MRAWTAVPRSIRFASAIAAVALLGACADSNTAASVAGPSGPDLRSVVVPSSPTPTEVLVCVNTTATISTEETVGAATVGGSTSIASGGTVAANDNCQIVATETGSGGPAQFLITLSDLPAGATLVSTVCNDDATAGGATDCTGSTVQVGANAFHGSIVSFTVQLAPTVVEGCTVTRGFILNQLDSLTNGRGDDITVVINGDTLSKADIEEALTTPVKGDATIQLKAQLITALANISLGATSNEDVDDAIEFAEGVLDGDAATKSEISAAIATLTAFNEGTAGDGASIHCTDAEEAALKDKA